VKLLALLFSLMALTFWATAVGLSIYGLYLAFSASIILGIVAVFVEPAPLVLALVEILAHRHLAQEIVNWFNRLN
jgi:hypothetical protein